MSQKFASRYLMGVYVVHKVEYKKKEKFDEENVISQKNPLIKES